MLASFELALMCITAFVAISIIQFYYKKFFSAWGLSVNLPWIGAEDGNAVSRARVTLRTFLGTRDLIQDGYHKV